MIEWVQNGGEPHDFVRDHNEKEQNKKKDPFAEDWKDLGPNIKVKYKGGEDYEIHLAMTGGQKTLETAQADQRILEGASSPSLPVS